MPAPTTYRDDKDPDGDIFVRIRRDRIDGYPWARFTFAPCDKVMEADGVTQKQNAFAQPLWTERPGLAYTLFLDSRNAVAFQRMVDMEIAATTLCAGGHLLDDAETTVAYELLADCVEKDSTAAILADLGVIVEDRNPFPA
jgi:hypothetical protein